MSFKLLQNKGLLSIWKAGWALPKSQGDLFPSNVAADPLPYAVQGTQMKLTGLVLPLPHSSQIQHTRIAHPAVTKASQNHTVFFVTRFKNLLSVREETKAAAFKIKLSALSAGYPYKRLNKLENCILRYSYTAIYKNSIEIMSKQLVSTQISNKNLLHPDTAHRNSTQLE